MRCETLWKYMRIYISSIVKNRKETFYGKVLSINALFSRFYPFSCLLVCHASPSSLKQASILIPFKPCLRLFRLYLATIPTLCWPLPLPSPSPLSSSSPLSFLTHPPTIVPRGSLVTVPRWPCTGGRKPPRNKGEHSLTWTYRGSDDPGSGRLCRPTWQKPARPLPPLRGLTRWWNVAARVCLPWHLF